MSPVRLARVPEALHRSRAQEPSARWGLFRLERRPVLLQSPPRSEQRRQRAGQRPLGYRRIVGADGVDSASSGPGRFDHRAQHDHPDVRHGELRRLRGRHGMGLPEMDRPCSKPAGFALGVVPGRGPPSGRHQLRRTRQQIPPSPPSAFRVGGLLGRRDPVAGQH